MTVYIDSMHAGFGRSAKCHMFADTDDELHALASQVGMGRYLHQSDSALGSHYAVPIGMRRALILAGAVEITWRQTAAMTLHRHLKGNLGDPEDSVAWLLARHQSLGSPTDTRLALGSANSVQPA